MTRTEKNLFKEAKKRFPIGTKFIVAHRLNDPLGKTQCTVKSHKKHSDLFITDGTTHLNLKVSKNKTIHSHERDSNLQCASVYADGTWAKVIEKPIHKTKKGKFYYRSSLTFKQFEKLLKIADLNNLRKGQKIYALLHDIGKNELVEFVDTKTNLFNTLIESRINESLKLIEDNWNAINLDINKIPKYIEITNGRAFYNKDDKFKVIRKYDDYWIVERQPETYYVYHKDCKEISKEMFESKLKLEIGKWYQMKSKPEVILCYAGKDEMNLDEGYGFSSYDNNEWGNNLSFGHVENWKLIDVNTVKSKLLTEAKRRYKIGDAVFDAKYPKSVETKVIEKLTQDENSFMICNSDISYLYFKGNWAKTDGAKLILGRCIIEITDEYIIHPAGKLLRNDFKKAYEKIKPLKALDISKFTFRATYEWDLIFTSEKNIAIGCVNGITLEQLKLIYNKVK